MAANKTTTPWLILPLLAHDCICTAGLARAVSVSPTDFVPRAGRSQSDFIQLAGRGRFDFSAKRLRPWSRNTGGDGDILILEYTRFSTVDSGFCCGIAYANLLKV